MCHWLIKVFLPARKSSSINGWDSYCGCWKYYAFRIAQVPFAFEFERNKPNGHMKLLLTMKIIIIPQILPMYHIFPQWCSLYCFSCKYTFFNSFQICKEKFHMNSADLLSPKLQLGQFWKKINIYNFHVYHPIAIQSIYANLPSGKSMVT